MSLQAPQSAALPEQFVLKPITRTLELVDLVVRETPGITCAEILGYGRTHPVALARHLVMWLAFKTVTENRTPIARAMGKQYTTVRDAIIQIDRHRAECPRFTVRSNRLLDLALAMSSDAP